MKTVGEVYLGFLDAQNYSLRENKDAFNNIFVKNTFLDELLQPNRYFLIGEKGTGKTAYATYLENNNYKETKAKVAFLKATDYEKFYRLKQNKSLALTDYAGIWRTILLLLLAKNVSVSDVNSSIMDKSGLKALNSAIDEYYTNAFSPEITTVMKIMDESSIVAKIIFNQLKAGGDKTNKVEFSETRFQHNLYYIEKSFSDVFSKLKLNKDIILFIDGIDIRPESMPYESYIECIRGLNDAAWELNTSVFPNVKDSKGRFRVVLLLRPDIFSSLNLQNATNKLLDNSVFLEWRTTYSDYKTSYLYEVAKKLLSYQQSCECEDIFEYYFPWSETKRMNSEEKTDTAFVDFLRISLSRPRDILVIMQFLQKKMKKDGHGKNSVFDKTAFKSDEFQNTYSEYFMGSLKDQLSFYYSNVDFEHFLRLFDYFKDSDFTYEEYEKKYNKFVDYILDNAKEIPKFVDDPKELLQVLYDSNIIAAIQKGDNDKSFFSFSYREKSSANVNPKVPFGENVTYRFHYGLYKKAKMGRF